MHVFETSRIGRVELKNRLLRSATFEGLGDAEGNPTTGYLELYRHLSHQGLGALITGFVSVSRDGRAMQPGQAGLETDAQVPAFRRVTEAVHRQGCPIFVQLAHAGRQTVPTATGGVVYAPSARKSPYFNSHPRALNEPQIEELINAFGAAARRAREAGFDGIQLHAAHGYLLHQFLDPTVNRRTDRYGLDPHRGIGTAFLGRVIERVRAVCGPDFPLLIKISAPDSCRQPAQQYGFVELIRYLEEQKLDALEISCGTMDRSLNIFRGASIPVEAILRFNPRYATRQPFKRFLWKWLVLPWMKRQFAPFTPMYNLASARLAKCHTTTPLISVGGFRNGGHLRTAIEEHGIDFVSLCRPILCEPDFALQVRRQPNYPSRCANCNRCAILCDSGHPTRCYGRTAEPNPPVL